MEDIFKEIFYDDKFWVMTKETYDKIKNQCFYSSRPFKAPPFNSISINGITKPVKIVKKFKKE